MSDYAKAAVSMADLEQQTLEAFGLGRQLLDLCREAGLPEPQVCGDGWMWVMFFQKKGGGPGLRVWVGVSGGIDLRAVDGDGPVLFARDRTPEQAVAWLKERLA